MKHARLSFGRRESSREDVRALHADVFLARAGGVVPPDDIISTDGEFDPDAFESDDILDDVKDNILDDDIALAGIDDEIDPLIEDVV